MTWNGASPGPAELSVGDAVDNVPGVPLLGPKLARELLEKYDTLDNVLNHAAEVSGVLAGRAQQSQQASQAQIDSAVGQRQVELALHRHAVATGDPDA